MLRKLLRNTIGQWSLEQKCSLFFGLGLLFSICGSFWIVQKFAEDLVIETTRHAARSYADMQIAWRHVSADSQDTALNEATLLLSPPKVGGLLHSPAVLDYLRKFLVDIPQYEYKILALEDPDVHRDLDDSSLVSPEERYILEELLSDYRERWLDKERVRADALRKREIPPAITVAQAPLGSPDNLTASNTSTALDDRPIFRETGTIGGNYNYYHVVRFDIFESCAECHSTKASYTTDTIVKKEFSTEKSPFRVVRVSMPYKDTRASPEWMLAVMIAVAMVTIVVTLLIFHVILRKLVIKPLRHLRNVSDEISRGKYDLRAKIGTGDEFNELAEAFNRMLRHLTETQDKLRSLNSELDVKVDQLAQANLNLYEANRLKSDFLANMSHELRTPLNSIIGFSDVLHDISSLTEKQKRYAANIQKSGRTLLEMINDILDLAKVEAGKMEVRSTSFDIGQVVHAQCDMMRSLSEERNIDLQVDIQAEMEPAFQDQPKIQQILTNLLSNAIKFTPEGGLINVSASSCGELAFSLTVSDTGVGIPESDFEVIFEKFRQSKAILEGDNLARQFSGTGLGLSIVKELCKLLGGEIKVASEIGKGSTFCIVLPNHYHPSARAEILHHEVAALKAS